MRQPQSIYCFCSLLLVGLCSSPVSGICPTTLCYNKSIGQCRYEDDDICIRNGSVMIRDGDCMTSSGQEGLFYSGSCLFGHRMLNRTDRMTSKLPCEPEIMDELMCGPYNRKGLLCGDCIDGYGPAVYSFKPKCVLQLLSHYILLLELLPITLVYIFLLFSRFNITSGLLLGCMMFCQCYIIWLQQNFYIYEYTLHTDPMEFCLKCHQYYPSFGAWNIYCLSSRHFVSVTNSQASTSSC